MTETMKLGFAKAVMERGDGWLFAFDTSGASADRAKLSAATWLAMREGGGEWKDALRMKLCETTDGRLFQLEQPLYRCGCDGLCDKHPNCPGVIYQPGFQYRRQQGG